MQDMSGHIISANEKIPVPINIDQPRWNQKRFIGRLNYFARVCNPFLLFKSANEYRKARELVYQAREGYVPVGVTVQQLYAAKVLYDSAYHPDTGEEMTTLGRMSAQVPGGMVIIGLLLAYYKTVYQVIAGQWLNQSFNAMVNYTNRNAKSQITKKEMAFAYASATSGAVAVAVSMNTMVKRAPPIVRRWVPFVAVAAANCINIPVMRQRELIDGVVVTDENGNDLAKSQRAAAKGISLVCISRIFIASPSMLLVPVLMQRLERHPFFKRGLLFSAALQIVFSGVCLAFSVPIGCALFPQQSSMRIDKLEKTVQEEIRSYHNSTVERVYFNKGL